MILNKIRIVNYKSIKDVSIDIKRVGDSYTTIFVGLNESGKSNFLDAISLINPEKTNIKFADCINNSVDDSNRIECFFYYSFPEQTPLEEILTTKINAPKDFIDNILINGICNHVFLEKGLIHCKSEYNVIYTNNIQKLEKFLFRKSTIANDEVEYLYDICSVSETQQETTDYKILTENDVKIILNDVFSTFFSECKLTYSKWEYKPEFLITKDINLNEFKANPDICHPLKNIFALAGYTDKEKISKKIENISGNVKYIQKFKNELQDVLTKYVEQVWEECSLKFEIDIQDSMILRIFVKDTENDNDYFTMSDRSEGARHFLSLILSISVENDKEILKNNIIVIDEPEVHMHPSGIRYIRKELLRIGENNYVFVATHSQFIIDNENKERHYIVRKVKNCTELNLWDNTKEIADDEILRQAFGINVLTDLLSPHKILVEGASDCKIIKKALNILLPNNDIVITNGHGSNIIQVASYLKYYNVNILTILDSDEQGTCYKDKILKIGGPYNSNTVKDISLLINDFVQNGTIEDTMDCDYIINCCKEKINNIIWDDFKFDEKTPIIDQIKKHIILQDTEKTIENIDNAIKNIKVEIAEKLNINKKSLKDKNPKLETLCNKILEHFGLKSK